MVTTKTAKNNPPTTTVLLVRHGRTPTTGQVLPGRTKGLHLSDEGIKQARLAAEIILSANKTPVAIYASPLERTRETAAEIAKVLDVKVAVDKGLLECEFGDWTGAKLKDLYKLPEWKAVQQSPSTFRFPGGESFLEMQARINDAVTRLRKKHVGETVILVSHADPIKAAVASALGTPLDLFQRIHIAPCSVSAIQYAEDIPTVLFVNTVHSLGDL